jgi:hypothetical protein
VEGTVIHVKKANSRSRRYSMALSSDAVIAIAGEKGTPEVIDLAWTADKPIIPIAGTGGATKEGWEKYRPDLISRLGLRTEEIRALEEEPVDPQKVATVCVTVLRRILLPRCFIAMKIGEHKVPSCYEWISDICKDKGYSPLRVDQESFTGSVVEAIWGDIRGCEVFIADLTDGNLNVVYEVGISHALGKQTVLIVYDSRGQVPEYIPFDLRHHRILPYTDHSSLAAQLQKHLPQAR